MAQIELRQDKLADLRRVGGLESDAELARRIGVRQSSVHRVLSGANKPGNRFIAGLLDTFGGEQWFEKLFVIVSDKSDES